MGARALRVLRVVGSQGTHERRAPLEAREPRVPMWERRALLEAREPRVLGNAKFGSQGSQVLREHRVPGVAS